MVGPPNAAQNKQIVAPAIFPAAALVSGEV